MRAQLRGVMARLAAGRLDPSAFTPEAQKKFGAQMQEASKDFLANEGALGKLELLSRKEEKEENGERVYTYRGHFEYGGVLRLVLRLTSEGKIAGLQFASD